MYNAEQVVLIGMGGFGTAVAEEIYGKLSEAQKTNVVIHAFDTDSNDIDQRKNLKGIITQTSGDKTVGQYLKYLEKYNNLEKTLKWFPDHPIIRNQPMANGAGQVRAVSRLAFLSAMESGKMDEIREKIRALKRNSSSELSRSMRVYLISTLAGGTGSGMFLQMALYLREYIETELKTKPLIFGSFLLPETLIGTGKLHSPVEFPNLRCNAYASVKELDAIMEAARFPETGINDNLEMEYRPGQYDIHGNPDIKITAKRYPFNSVFLFDSQNSKGEVLTDFKFYMNQVVESIYQSTFTMFAPGVNSEIDNFVQTALQEHGKNLYCSTGVGKLVYPYENMIQYLTYKWAESSISNEWLKIDNLCEQENLDIKKNRRLGVVTKPFSLSESFQKYFNSIVDPKVGENNYKFQLINKSLYNEEEDGTLGKSHFQSFYDEVNIFIDNFIDEKMKNYNISIKETKNILTQDLNNDDFNTQILELDELLQNKWADAEDFPLNNVNYLINKIIMSDGENPNLREGRSYQFNTWIFSQNGEKCMHPVAIRYFLYNIIQLLKDGIKHYQKKEIEKIEEKFKLRFDDPKTPDVIEDEDRLHSITQNKFKFMLNKKKFLKEYKDKAISIDKAIDTYVEYNLKNSVFTNLLSHIEYFNKQWENFFDSFDNIKKNISNEKNKYLNKHKPNSKEDETVRYVLNEPQHMKNMWDMIEKQTDAADDMPMQLFIAIYKGMYNNFISQQQKAKGKENFLDARELFEESAIKYYKEQLYRNKSIDLDIFSALRKMCEFDMAEEEYGSLSLDDMMKGYIHEIDIITSEWLYTPKVDKDNLKSIDHWGYNPEAEKNNTIFKDHRSLKPDDGFSKYELVKLSSIFGLKIEDIPQFSAGKNETQGVYFKAYSDRIRTINKEEKLEKIRKTVLSPHIDKRWHLPGFMNDPNTQINIENNNQILTAFIYGLSLDNLLYFNNDDRQPSWYFRSEKLVDLDNFRVTTIGNLLNYFFYSPYIVKEITKEASKRKRRDILDHNHDIEKHELYSGIIRNNSFDKIMILIRGDLSDNKISKRIEMLPGMFLDIITKYIQETKNIPIEEALLIVERDLLPELKENSPGYTDISSVRPQKILVDNLIEKYFSKSSN